MSIKWEKYGNTLEIVTDIYTAQNTHYCFAKVLCRWENLAYQNFKSLPTWIPEGKTSKTFNYIPPMSQEERENKCSVISSGERRKFSFCHFPSKFGPHSYIVLIFTLWSHQLHWIFNETAFHQEFCHNMSSSQT